MLSTLFDDAPEMEIAPVTGEWFPIRLMPNIATGEIFNVGVALRTPDGQTHLRLIDNARPFKCLYGHRGLENFSFLLTAFRQSVDTDGRLDQPFPQIRYGEKSFAAGDSVNQILDNLYETMISLQCDESEEEAAEKIYTVSTERIQKRVFGMIKKERPQAYDRVFRATPVILEDQNHHPLRLELPIWNEHPNMFKAGGPRFGTIVSAHYRDPVHRHYNLDGGALNMVNAAMLLDGKRAHGGIFILRPAEGSAGYSPFLMVDIENDIDRATWALQRRRNVTITVSPDERVLMDAALELAS